MIFLFFGVRIFQILYLSYSFSSFFLVFQLFNSFHFLNIWCLQTCLNLTIAKLGVYTLAFMHCKDATIHHPPFMHYRVDSIISSWTLLLKKQKKETNYQYRRFHHLTSSHSMELLRYRSRMTYTTYESAGIIN